MKIILFSFVFLISTIAYSKNSRIRDYDECTLRDTFQNISMDITYRVDVGEECRYSPGIVSCSERMPNVKLYELEPSCYQHETVTVNFESNSGRKIQKLTRIYLKDSRECAGEPRPIRNDWRCYAK